MPVNGNYIDLHFTNKLARKIKINMFKTFWSLIMFVLIKQILKNSNSPIYLMYSYGNSSFGWFQQR